MSKKQKLELTWIGKDVRPKLEPRILIEDAKKSYYAPTRTSDADVFDNRLIFGDNLLALKALEQEFTGKVKCVYIDPPFNSGNAFKEYDDRVEHSLWLSLMRMRIEIIHHLLSDNGAFFIHLDDKEIDYCRVLLDEIFGRSNFMNRITVASRSPCLLSALLILGFLNRLNIFYFTLKIVLSYKKILLELYVNQTRRITNILLISNRIIRNGNT